MDPPSSRHAIFLQSGGIRVNVVYPSFAIVSWEQPRYRGGTDAPLMERVTWRYTVEWSCACSSSQAPFQSSGGPTALTYAVIPFHHPAELYRVRVTARGTLAGSAVGTTTANTTFLAECNVRFPWLQPGALCTPLLYDCLYLATNSDHPEASLASRPHVSTIEEGVWVLESGLVAAAHRLMYSTCPAPLSSPLTIVLVAVGLGQAAAAAKRAERLSNAQLIRQLGAENSCLVLCGVGELGGSAALATYALMAALLKAGEEPDVIASRVFCLAYGASRRCLAEASSALLEAGRMSGNVLFYTGMMAVSSLDGGHCVPFPNAMFASGLPPALALNQLQQLSASFRLLPPESPANSHAPAAAGAGATPHEERSLLNVPVGVRAGLVGESGTNRLILVGEASTPAMPTDEEQCECLDTRHHLALLELLLFSDESDYWERCSQSGEEPALDTDPAAASASGELRPVITAITHELTDRTSARLRVYIGGRHLHYSPRVTCLTSPGGTPLTMTVVSCSPSQVVCEASLIPNICSACFAAAAVNATALPPALAVSLLLQTEMGFTEHSCVPYMMRRAQADADDWTSEGRAGRRPPDDRRPVADPTGPTSKVWGETKPGGAPHAADDNDAQTSGGPIVHIPRSVTELLYKACRRRVSADAWIVGFPISLIDAVISSLPFWAFDSDGRDLRVIDHNISSSRAIRYMCHLATAAELATQYRSRKPQNGLLAFMEKVTARIANQSELLPGGITLTALPKTEALYLRNALKELAVSSGMPLSAYLARMISWKKRVFVGLPELDENAYRLKLQRLLLILPENDLASREQPLTALEMQVYSSLVQHLRTHPRNSRPTRSRTSQGKRSQQDLSYGEGGGRLERDFIITEMVTFEEFFDLTHALFLPTVQSSTIEGAEAAIVSEVCFLWAVCVILQLRHEYTTATRLLLAVTGCRGSGCSTVATALSAVCNELVTSLDGVDGSRRNVVVRQVPETALVLLRELMSLGVAVIILITAELSDFGGLAFAAITRSIRGSITDQANQRVHVALTKVDERLSFVALEEARSGEDGAGHVAAMVRAVTTAATAAASQSSMEKLAPVPLSLCPSLGSVRAALRSVQSGIPEETFAAELLHQSIDRLRDLVLRDVQISME